MFICSRLANRITIPVLYRRHALVGRQQEALFTAEENEGGEEKERLPNSDTLLPVQVGSLKPLPPHGYWVKNNTLLLPMVPHQM